MNMKIERQGDRIVIRIAQTGRSEQEVAGVLRECCTQSSWACPSGECAKLDTLDARREGESMLITLTPRAGETLSEHAIGECLRYMFDEARSGTTR